MITKHQLIQWLLTTATTLEQQKDYLTELYSPLLRNGLLDLRLHQRYNDVIHFTRAGGLLV